MTAIMKFATPFFLYVSRNYQISFGFLRDPFYKNRKNRQMQFRYYQ